MLYIHCILFYLCVLLCKFCLKIGTVYANTYVSTLQLHNIPVNSHSFICNSLFCNKVAKYQPASIVFTSKIWFKYEHAKRIGDHCCASEQMGSYNCLVCMPSVQLAHIYMCVSLNKHFHVTSGLPMLTLTLKILPQT